MQFVEFCYRVPDRNPVVVLEAACAEMFEARRLNRERTGRPDFRLESVGRRYCDQLDLLVRYIMGGGVSHPTLATFKHDVEPLARRMLKTCEIVGFRELFPNDV